MKQMLMGLMLALGVACGGGGSSASAPSAGGAEQDMGMYAGKIYGCVMSFFTAPPGDMAGLAIHLELRISPEGVMQEPTVLKPSENPEYDAAMIAAAKQCSNLPPPPASIAPTIETTGLRMVFKPQ